VSRTGKPVSGTEPVAFDYGKASNLDTLFDGVDRTYLLLPSGYPDAKGLLSPIVQVAASRGVKVVLQSVLGVDADDNIPYRQVALLLERSEVPFVILRPNWFADNFHAFWKADITHGKILLRLVKARRASSTRATSLLALPLRRPRGKRSSFHLRPVITRDAISTYAVRWAADQVLNPVPPRILRFNADRIIICLRWEMVAAIGYNGP
jgi:uncharacterized protein YbjT (DUF2867 family)